MRISDWSSDVCSSDLMTPAAPIDLSRHLRREMIARGHLDLAVRIAVPILMVHFREKGARQAGVAIAVFHRGIEVERAADAQCGGLIAQAVEAVEGVEPTGDSHIPSRSEEHTSELQSLMRISYAVFCLKKKKLIQ